MVLSTLSRPTIRPYVSFLSLSTSEVVPTCGCDVSQVVRDRRVLDKGVGNHDDSSSNGCLWTKVLENSAVNENCDVLTAVV